MSNLAYNKLLQPKEVEIELPEGGTKTFIISKFPAIAGREIITQYPLSAMPKLGDYKTNEALMLKIMGYVGIETEAGYVPFITEAAINNHILSFETLMKLYV